MQAGEDRTSAADGGRTAVSQVLMVPAAPEDCLSDVEAAPLLQEAKPFAKQVVKEFEMSGKSGCTIAPNSLMEDNFYDCNICLDTPLEPVATLCGHMYCWSCIYEWLSLDNNECPVCKAAVTGENVVPIYGRNEMSIDPRSKSLSAPPRPIRERLETHQIQSTSLIGRSGQDSSTATADIVFVPGIGFVAGQESAMLLERVQEAEEMRHQAESVQGRLVLLIIVLLITLSWR